MKMVKKLARHLGFTALDVVAAVVSVLGIFGAAYVGGTLLGMALAWLT